MTGRILRIELRRSAAVWAAALSLPVVFLWPQVTEGMTAVVGQHRSELVFYVPLALAIGAAQARRDHTSRTRDLLTSTARPEWQRRLPTATALGMGAVTGFVAVYVGLVAYAVVIGAYIPVSMLVAAMTTALCLVGAVWLGLAIGRALPSLIVPPLLLVVGVVGMTFVFFAADTEGYRPGPPPGRLLLILPSSTGFNASETLTTPARLAQLVWAIALAAGALILCVARRHLRLAAVVPVVVGLAGASALLPRSLHDAISLDRGGLALVCTSDSPGELRVCARRMHPLVLDDLREPGREALTLLTAKLPQAPTTVAEAYHGHDAPAGVTSRPDVLYAEVSTDGEGHIEATEREVLWGLLMGAGTLPCEDPFATGAQRYITARLIAAAWLLEEAPPPPTDPTDPAQPGTAVTRPAYETLLALPAAEQRARVAALREAELTCSSGDRLDILIDDRPAP